MKIASFLAAHARLTPDKDAVICGDERLTFAQLDDTTDRLANSLRSLGVGRRRPGRAPAAEHRGVRARIHGGDQGRRHFGAGQYAPGARRDRLHPRRQRAESRIHFGRDARGLRKAAGRKGVDTHHHWDAESRASTQSPPHRGGRARHARSAERVRRQHDHLYLGHHRQAQGRDRHPGQLDHPQRLPERPAVRDFRQRPPPRHHAACPPHRVCAHGEHAAARGYPLCDAAFRSGRGGETRERSADHRSRHRPHRRPHAVARDRGASGEFRLRESDAGHRRSFPVEVKQRIHKALPHGCGCIRSSR